MARPPGMIKILAIRIGEWMAEYGLALLGLLLGIAVLAIYEREVGFPLGGEAPEWAAFGVFFGAIMAPALAFLVLLGLLDAMKLQRGELAAARSELEKSTSALEEQHRALKLQNFEYTFFEMIKLLDAIVSNLRIPPEDHFTGREAMLELWLRLQREFQQASAGENGADAGGLACVSAVCMDFFTRWSHITGHYFMTVTNVLALVDRAPVEDRESYARILRGMLSRAELSLVFYLCLTRLGDETLNRMVKRYELLGDLSLVDVLHARHRELYR